MKRKSKEPQRDLPGLIMIITFGIAVLACASVLVYMLAWQSHFNRDVMRPVPPFFATAAAAQPLPVTVAPSNYQNATVKRAYTIALKKPALLAQQPCYCGCSRLGHRSLLDCFKDGHAAGCSICTREASYASELDAQGKCASEIRDGIIRGKWKSLEVSSE